MRRNPACYLSDAGLPPDIWQREILESPADKKLLLITRQGGKSQVSAALALKEALEKPESLVLLLSPTLRQSVELFRAKLMYLYNKLGRPVVSTKDNSTNLELLNGSRIVSLPGDEKTIRGYSKVNLLIIDEASRVSDELYNSVKPMLAVSKGSMVALSTPFGKRGWFYEVWTKGEGWQKVRLRANQCPRITPEWLEEERKAIGDLWYDQEYGTEFVDTVASLYRQVDIDAAGASTEKGYSDFDSFVAAFGGK